MTTFDDRVTAYENKFAHDQEMNFKAEARCNKLLAIWAAGVIGKPESELDGYIREVINSDFEEAGDEDVIRKVAADLGAASDIETVRAQRAKFLSEAKIQLLEES